MNKNNMKTLDSLNADAWPRCKRSTWIAMASLIAILCGCSTASIERRSIPAPTQTSLPTVIYVADFDLDASDIPSGQNSLPPFKGLPSPFPAELPGVSGTAKDSSAQATEWVQTLSQALIRELKSAGLDAQRIASGSVPPASGWLLRGAITRIDPGHQMKRAVIGFGEGKTELRVVVHLEDLKPTSGAQIAGWTAASDSGKAPGAGPMLVLGPGVLAVRMIAAGQDLQNNIRQTATMIAAEVRTRAQGTAHPL